jgi:hypothetical protein
MAIEAWMYGNPETVAIRREEAALRKLKNCQGCKHHKQMVYDGTTLNRCEIKRHGYGTPNCQQYSSMKGKG